jgi:hypothetical protein
MYLMRNLFVKYSLENIESHRTSKKTSLVIKRDTYE